MDDFGKQALDAHNKYRAQHQSPPLAWSQQLAKEAKAWADKLASTGVLQHAPREKREGSGENIYMMMGKTNFDGSDPVESWYSEVSSM